MKHPDCCAETAGHHLLPLNEALARIRAAIHPLAERERVVLKQAYGRVLAQEVAAHIDSPPYSNASMDGYALRAEDLPQAQSTGLRRLGTAYAGHPYSGNCEEGGCVRIFTGAAIPAGADAVVMQEGTEVIDDRVLVRASVRPGDNIRPIGDEIRAGAPLLPGGKRLNAADLGLLAANGFYDLPVLRKVRVAHFSTGDELRPIGQVLGTGEIHDSNRYTLHALLQHPCVQTLDLGVVRDDAAAVQRALRGASEFADLIISTGGVSVGEADFVSGALAECGHVDFWKLAIKPGKPLAFGRVGNAWFFGLPGNPVAVIVTFWQLVRPALQQLIGTPWRPALRLTARCRSRIRKTPGRLEFLRGRYQADDNGSCCVSLMDQQGSHQLLGLSAANCLIVLPAECSGVEPGQPVAIELLDDAW